MNEPYLKISNLKKEYPGVVALNNANIDFYAGEVHALLGENGAGKSTLCKIISGAEAPDSGEIIVDGNKYSEFDPISAKNAGISMVYQELNLVPSLTVYENFFLGKEKKNGVFLDKKYMISETKKSLSTFGIEIDPTEKVKNLSVALQQLLEITKIIYENAKVIILDEPTAPLTNEETAKLFNMIRQLKQQNITIIFISHRLEELFEIAEKVTVMRDGNVIETLNTAETTKNQLVQLMVARELGEDFPEKGNQIGDPILKVENLTTTKLKDVNFTLHKGEVLGLAGLVGSGRTETLRAVFGADERLSGDIEIDGKKADIRSPEDGVRSGIALISEDRKRDGLLMKMNVKENISVIILSRICNKLSIIKKKEEEKVASDSIEKFNIKTPSQEQIVKNLSGGNQQKVILAKWVAENSPILFMDEPTRGIDVGAKQEIYELIDSFRKEGRAILMVSSELPELIGMSDRVLVMYEGKLQGELTGDQITQENILSLASGEQAV